MTLDNKILSKSSVKQNSESKVQNGKAIYKEFDYKTDIDYYWISVLCSNCWDNRQIGVKLGVKVNSSRLKFLICPKCKVKGTLSQAMWNGKFYEVIKK